ncbi:hypothetical protein D1872_269310 [compost metagenome]
MRQIDPDELYRRARTDHGWSDPGGRRRHQRHEPQGSRHRHGVPVLRAVPDHERAREHRIRSEDPQNAHCGNRRRSGSRFQVAADRTPAQSQAGPALRRPATARGDGTCPRAAAEDLSVRRTVVQPRRQAAGRDAHRNETDAPAPENHHGLRDPRPDRSHDPGR